MGTVNLKVATKFDGSSMQRGLMKAQAGVKRLGTRIKAMATGAKAALGGMGMAMGGMLLAAQLKESIAYGSKISDMAMSLGISNERLQELEFIATRGGAAVEDVHKAFIKLGQTSQDARAGLKDVVNAYKSFGISAEELEHMSPEQLFDRVSAAMKDAPRTLEFFDNAMLVLGKTATKILPMMALDFKKVTEEARATGAIMSNETVDQLDTMEDRMLELGMSWRSSWGSAAIWVADVWHKAAEGMSVNLQMLITLFQSFYENVFVRATKFKPPDFAQVKKDLMATHKEWNEMENAYQTRGQLQEEEKRKQAELKRLQDEKNAGLEREVKLREEAAKRVEDTKAALEKIAAMEFKRMSPEEQLKVLEKRLEVAKNEEKTAGWQGMGKHKKDLSDDDIAHAKAGAKLKRMELEDQLAGVRGAGVKPMTVGQDQLARMGMFRGFQTEQAIVANRQLERLKSIDAAALKVAANTGALVAP